MLLNFLSYFFEPSNKWTVKKILSDTNRLPHCSAFSRPFNSRTILRKLREKCQVMLANEHGKIPGSQIRCRLMISISIFPENQKQEKLSGIILKHLPRWKISVWANGISGTGRISDREIYSNGAKEMESLSKWFRTLRLSIFVFSLSLPRNHEKKDKKWWKTIFLSRAENFNGFFGIFRASISPDS